MQQKIVPSLTGIFRLSLKRKKPRMLSSMIQYHGAPASRAWSQMKLRAGPEPVDCPGASVMQASYSA